MLLLITPKNLQEGQECPALSEAKQEICLNESHTFVGFYNKLHFLLHICDRRLPHAGPVNKHGREVLCRTNAVVLPVHWPNFWAVWPTVNRLMASPELEAATALFGRWFGSFLTMQKEALF